MLRDICSGDICSADICSADNCSEDTTFAPPTIAPATDAPKIRHLLRRYLFRICNICSADNCSKDVRHLLLIQVLCPFNSLIIILEYLNELMVVESFVYSSSIYFKILIQWIPWHMLRRQLLRRQMLRRCDICYTDNCSAVSIAPPTIASLKCAPNMPKVTFAPPTIIAPLKYAPKIIHAPQQFVPPSRRRHLLCRRLNRQLNSQDCVWFFYVKL